MRLKHTLGLEAGCRMDRNRFSGFSEQEDAKGEENRRGIESPGDPGARPKKGLNRSGLSGEGYSLGIGHPPHNEHNVAKMGRGDQGAPKCRPKSPQEAAPRPGTIDP